MKPPARSRRSANRPLRWAAGTAVATLAVTGCSAGQVSQSANQLPAVNGSHAAVGTLTLQNVHLRAPQQTDFVPVGSEVELLFVTTNQAPDMADELQAITTELGSVDLTGDTTIPANGLLSVGAPDRELAVSQVLAEVEPADVAEAVIELAMPISNGLMYPVTFTFAEAGDVTLEVPIDAGDGPRRGPEVVDHGPY